SPWTSLLGESESKFGLGTVAAYLGVFLSVRALVRTPDEARWLMGWAVLASAVVSGYGLVQALGLDPLEWGNISEFAGWQRPASTLGHPMHLAGYLAIVFPLTVWAARAYG